MLAKEQVEAIYMIKISTIAEYSRRHKHCAIDAVMRGKSGPLASKYGVSPRTIRDIWNRKTWGYATEHLWSLEQEQFGVSGQPSTIPSNSLQTQESNPSMEIECAEAPLWEIPDIHSPEWEDPFHDDWPHW